ncbi:uncharacterized protein LOC142630347 [Castanea sativa]|uniref:uncharacterized protein LOC142630347 n=1 Tax=Castanea sativa TaxID=21020 RepID=UPI003F64CCF1
MVSGRIARWAVLLQQYDLAYVPQKAIKGQVLADFLADHPVPSDWEFSDDFPDEDVFYIEVMPPWMMFFNGVARQEGVGAGVVFVSPQRQILLYSFSLSELCSSNVVEYQALIIGLQMAIEIGISQLEIFGDSKLIINQILEQYDVKKEDLDPYCKYAKKLLANFKAITLEHIPRKENRQADALANLATTLALSQEETAKVVVSQRWVVPFVVEEEKEEKQANVISVCLVVKEDWRQTIIEYLQHGRLPDDPPEPLHPTVASWPFDAWGLDAIRPLPKSSGGHLYILAATDYFSKWAEAVPLREVKKETVVNFIRTHLIYRYGVPRYIITDNGKPFQNRLMTELC